MRLTVAPVSFIASSYANAIIN